jgi:hypothetical protein
LQASLILSKEHRVLFNAVTAKDDLIRIVDESGEELPVPQEPLRAGRCDLSKNAIKPFWCLPELKDNGSPNQSFKTCSMIETYWSLCVRTSDAEDEDQEKEIAMALNPELEREQAHALLNHLPDAQVPAIRGLLEAMLDPVSRALAVAPIDDEPVSEAEELAVAEAREWLRQNPGIPFEQVVAELGFTMEDVKNYQDPA